MLKRDVNTYLNVRRAAALSYKAPNTICVTLPALPWPAAIPMW